MLTFRSKSSFGARRVGPIVGGQVISKLGVIKGFAVICILSAGMTACILPAIVIYSGGPLKWSRSANSADDPDLEGKEVTS